MKKKNTYIIVALLIIISLAAFGRIAGNHFINLDDPVYITKNHIVQNGLNLQNAKWAFTTRYANLWHPLVWLSLMFDYELYGLNAGGYHMTNLILHILSTLLLFWLFNRMTNEIWKSAFVAAFFALHPLHVESVAWASERKDVLSAFFWMLTLYLYVCYTEKPTVKRYLGVVFSFVLALMSKPMVVTLPLIMILLDYWPLKRFELKKTGLNMKGVALNKGFLWFLSEKTPFFILSAVLVFITLFTTNEQEQSFKIFPLLSRFANAPISFVAYLEKTFWPHDMAIFYPFPIHISLWQVLGSSLLIIVVSVVVIVLIKRLPYLFVGWLWFSITIAPVIGIIQISSELPYAMADRYHYLPSIGIAVMLAWGIPLLLPNENIRKKILFPAAIFILFILAILTWVQCGYWKSITSLFNHTLQVTKKNNLSHDNIGYNYNELVQYQSQNVIQDYNEAIRLKPDDYMAYYDRGIAYAKIGQYKNAIRDYNEAIRLKPDYAEAYNNRGNIYGQHWQHELAIKDFNKAINLKPDHIKAYNNRGLVYSELKQYQNAIEDFNKAINLKPDYASAYNNRANVYLKQGNSVSGCRDAHKACTLGNCKIMETARLKGLCR